MPLAQAAKLDCEALHETMRTERHKVIHDVIALSDLEEHLADALLFLGDGNSLVAKMGGVSCRVFLVHGIFVSRRE